MTIEQMHKPVATHEQMAERLKALMDGPTDVSTLPVFYHNALDLTLHVGPMAGPSYEAWDAHKFLEKKRHEDSGGAKNGAPMSTAQSDAYLLQHAVWTSDGKNLDEATVKAMMKAPKCGPSNFAMVRAAKAQNPPREMLTAEFAVLFASAQTSQVLWELLFAIGEGKALVDFLAPSATPDERAHAERQIVKAREALSAMSPYLNTRQAAQALGISFNDAAQTVAHDAIEQARKAA